MPKPLELWLTPAQRAELEDCRDHSPRPYLRVRAAALLKVAAGSSGRAVACHGLLKAVQPRTVYAWVHRYQAEGLAGLRVRPGRGRKPAFPPSLWVERRGR